jgi:large subunit ribosomal protein L10
MTSEIKTMQLSELDKRIASSSAFVIVGVTGLNGSQNLDVRRKAREKGGRMFLLKNSLALLQFKQRGWNELEASLLGPSAAIFGSDGQSLARLARDLQKTYQGKVELRAALMDGQVFIGASAMKLADLPSREELFAKVLGMLATPASSMLGAISSPAGSLMSVLEQLKNSQNETKAA